MGSASAATIVNGDFDDESNWIIRNGSADSTNELSVGQWVAVSPAFGVRFDTADANGNDLDLAQITVTNTATNVARSLYQLVELGPSEAGDFSLNYDINYAQSSTPQTDRRWNVAVYGIEDTGTAGFSITAFTNVMPFGQNSNIPVVSDADISVLAFDEPDFVSGQPQPATNGFVSESVDFTIGASEYDYLLVRLAGRLVNNPANNDTELVQFDNISITSPTAIPEPSMLVALSAFTTLALMPRRRRTSNCRG
ncbi:MAG: hypothetical protein AAF745_01490 [Planctomycetota bacterium]